mgnify:CR=1 FL=1
MVNTIIITKTRNKIFTKDLSNARSHTIHYGFIYDSDEFIDEVMVSVMKAPKSFTTEDVVEEAIKQYGKDGVLWNQTFHKSFDKVANALIAIGIKEDDIVTMSLPNIPQALYFIYAFMSLFEFAVYENEIFCYNR